MKTFQINNLFTILILVVVIASCVKDDDFTTPPLNIQDPVIDGDKIEMSALAGILAQSNDAVVPFNGTNTYVEGFVISSDEGGNFFKQLIVQDKSENPSIGVKVLVDVSPLNTMYEFGRKVYIKLDGLTLGTSNGVLALGTRNGNNVARIPFAVTNQHIIRSAVVEEIVPLNITIEGFSDSRLNQYIRLNNVQFNRNDVLGENPKTFAAEPSDQFDGERVIESCESEATTILSTSTFSSFKGLRLPSGSGSIEGVLVRDFYDNFYTVYLNNPNGINFDNPLRCDPDILSCDGPSGGPYTILSQNFENITNINQLAEWENINVSEGNVRFTLGNFSNNNFAQISGFQSGEQVIEAWFVSPEMNFDTSSAQQLEMDIEAAYDNGKILSVLITENYTGEVTSTDWELLDVNVPMGPTSGFGGFQSVGPVNISCFEGNVRIAFRYLGSAPSATTRYHLDNIKISGVQ